MNIKKLVLFDIDGTLIYPAGTYKFADQYQVAMQEVYGVAPRFEISHYNGTVDRYNAWDMARLSGVPRHVFLSRFPEYIEAMHRILDARKNETLFTPIESAIDFVSKLKNRDDVALGVITGNAKKIALWKLVHTGIEGYFPFGLYGDEADDRVELAGMVFEKAKRELGLILRPADITVIGDTIYDIRCGKAIGARTIGVTTGLSQKPRDELAPEKPDLLVDSLLEPAVLDLFSL